MPTRATVNGEMEEEPLVKNTLKIFSKTQSDIAHDQITQDGRSGKNLGEMCNLKDFLGPS